MSPDVHAHNCSPNKVELVIVENQGRKDRTRLAGLFRNKPQIGA